MEAYSMDLRVRIVESYRAHEGSQAELAERFKVSERWLQNLLRQHRETGSIEPLPHGGGRQRAGGPEQEVRLLTYFYCNRFIRPVVPAAAGTCRWPCTNGRCVPLPCGGTRDLLPWLSGSDSADPPATAARTPHASAALSTPGFFFPNRLRSPTKNHNASNDSVM